MKQFSFDTAPTYARDLVAEGKETPLDYEMSESTYPNFELIKKSYEEYFECFECGKRVLRGETFGSHTCACHPGRKLRAERMGREFTTKYHPSTIMWECCKKPVDDLLTPPCTRCDHRPQRTFPDPYMTVPSYFVEHNLIRGITKSAIIKYEPIYKPHSTSSSSKPKGAPRELDLWRSYWLISRYGSKIESGDPKNEKGQ